MIVSRSALNRHLSRIYCDGQLGEVVLFENFKCRAVEHPGRQVAVVTDGLEDVEPLGEPVGVLNLGLLIKTLKAFGEDDNDNINIAFDGFRIEIDEPGRGSAHLVSCDPKTVPTNLAAGTATKLLALFDFKAGLPIPQSTVASILKTKGLFNADKVYIHKVGDDITFRVGQANSDFAEIPLPQPGLKKKKGKKAAGEEYELILDAKMFAAVLSQLDDFTASQIALTGPDSAVAIWDGAITYVMSPQESQD